MSRKRNLSIDEVKELILKILIDFDSFCNHFNLDYSLAGGTLLGAVRHGGFIPWDDDIDVYVPRKDYDFILKNYNKWGRKKGYKVISSKNNGFYMMISKIIDTSTVAMEEHRTEKIGVWIDLLPVEYVDGMPSETKDKLYDLSENMYYFGKKQYLNTNNPFKVIKKKIARTIKKHMYISEYSKLINTYRGNSNICFYSKRRKKVWSILPKDLGIVNSGCTLNFEGHQFKVMKKWKEYLEIYFGKNYMELPPESERVSHECAIRVAK